MFSSGIPYAYLAGGAVGGVLAVTTAFGATSILGFKAYGIAAGSFAASMMSAAAIANGGMVPAGSMIAGLQAFATAGTGSALVAGVGAAVGSAVTAAVHLVAAN